MLAGKDSLLAKAKLGELKTKYGELKNKLKEPAIVGKAKQYIPKLDSLNTSLKFLNQNGIAGKVKDALAKTGSLQDKFDKAEEIKQFIKDRKEQLKQQLEKLGMLKQLKQFNKEVYYYAAQIKEYKEILKDPKKIEKKGLELLAKTKFFQDFMKKNSMLASLFRMPGDPNDPANLASLAGLQTRAQVNNLIQQQIAAGGPNAQQQFQQNLQNAQSQLSQLKDKVMKFGGGNSDDIMPEGFKPNNQKTKSFWNRWELGTNFQSQRSAGLLPTTTDIGISAGFKINDNSIIGIGGSTKIGWGRDIQHISLSGQGASLRSFADIKLKGSFWITGGYERHYRPSSGVIAPFSTSWRRAGVEGWHSSGLLGVSKVVSLKTKFFKKTKMQLLWDMLSYQQIPKTQPIVFRVGYNF